LKTKDYGFSISYAEAYQILGRDPQGPGRGDILKVREWLLEDFDKWLECDISKGYFIAHPKDHRQVAGRFSTQGRKRLEKTIKVLAHTNLEMLSPDEIQAHRQDQQREAIKLLVMVKVDKAKTIEEAQQIQIPTGKYLLEIYAKKIK
jgi:hypothetical protein